MRLSAAWFAALVLAAAAEASMILWGHQIAQGYVLQLRRYIPTQAVVMTARLDTIEETENLPERHLPVISYRYVANDRWEDGSRLLQGPAEHRAGSWARRIMDRYPPGAQVTAYYDRNVPRDVFLVREPPVEIGVLLAGGKYGLWFLGLYFLLRIVLWPRGKTAGQAAQVLIWGHLIWQTGLFVHTLAWPSLVMWTAGLFAFLVAIERES